MGVLQNGTYINEQMYNGSLVRSVATVSGNILHINHSTANGAPVGSLSGTYAINGNTLSVNGENYVLVVGGDWFSLDGGVYKKQVISSGWRY
jgi:hypothetical protein